MGNFHFDGFSTPNGTIVPDEFFDVLAPALSEAQLRVLLYIMRRTFGFKKQSDEISLKQMVEGITTHDGRVLDRGAGVAKSAAVRAVAGLVQKGIIIAIRNRSKERGYQATTYALRFADTPLSSKETRGSPARGQGLVLQEDIQQTVVQQAVLSSKIEREQQRREDTRPVVPAQPAATRVPSGFTPIGLSLPKRPPPRAVSDEDRQVIQAYLREVAQIFHDRASLRASTTRAVHLMQRAGVSREVFLSRLHEARSLTRESVMGGQTPIRHQMAFFFSVLADRLGLSNEPAPQRSSASSPSSSMGGEPVRPPIVPDPAPGP